MFSTVAEGVLLERGTLDYPEESGTAIENSLLYFYIKTTLHAFLPDEAQYTLLLVYQVSRYCRLCLSNVMGLL